jgi:opacity protein-like surface antigen
MKISAKTLLSIATAASITSLVSFHSQAQEASFDVKESGFYVGGNYGYLRIEGDDDFDEDNSVWQGLAGYQFNRWVAIEGSYIDFGDYGSEFIGAKTDGYTAALKGMIPLSERFTIYAKVGQLWSETEVTAGSLGQEFDDESLFAGAGLSYAITESLSINAEYSVYDTELDADEAFDDIDDVNFETDLKQATLGIVYRF